MDEELEPIPSTAQPLSPPATQVEVTVVPTPMLPASVPPKETTSVVSTVAAVVANIPQTSQLTLNPKPTKKRRSFKTTDSSASGLAVCLYDFSGEAEGDLCIAPGDNIELLAEAGDDWLRGRLNGQEGIFPREFVEVIQPLPAPAVPKVAAESAATPALASKPAPATGAATGRATCIHAFDGEAAEDLVIYVGAQVRACDSWSCCFLVVFLCALASFLLLSLCALCLGLFDCVERLQRNT